MSESPSDDEITSYLKPIRQNNNKKVVYVSVNKEITNTTDKSSKSQDKSCQTMITGDVLSFNFYIDKGAENRQINVPQTLAIKSNLSKIRDFDKVQKK